MKHAQNSVPEPELNDAQIERIDEIQNAVYDLCVLLTENTELVWNMEYIGEIADVACDILTRQGHRIRYPAIVYDPDGSSYIVNFHEGWASDKEGECEHDQ